MPAAPAVRPIGPIRAYFRDSSGATESAALTLPLLVFYGLGVLLLPQARNGVDFLSKGLHALLSLFGAATGLGYLAFYAVLIVANVGLVAWLSSKNRFQTKYFLPLLIECSIYAVIVGSISGTITNDLVGWLMAAGTTLSTTREMGPVTGLVVSAGAGLHEEFVFRLLGIGGIGLLWLGKDWRRPSVRLFALVLTTALVFSAVHHIVEPFTLTAFVFRTVAGVVFAALFLARGFAVAAWTHALYDVWVIVVLGR